MASILGILQWGMSVTVEPENLFASAPKELIARVKKNLNLVREGKRRFVVLR